MMTKVSLNKMDWQAKIIFFWLVYMWLVQLVICGALFQLLSGRTTLRIS